MKRGAARHLLVGFGVLAVFSLGMAAWYWPTVAMMVQNMTAMSEGGDEAKALRAPKDLLEYLVLHRDDVSLVAYDIEHPEEGIYHQADRPRTVVGLPRLLVLAEYARQVHEDLLDPEARVPPEAVAAYDVRGRAQPTPDSSRGVVTLSGLARRMMQQRDEAAADYLIQRLGRERLEALPAALGLARTDAPLPASGIYLSWRPAADEAAPPTRAARYRTLPSTAYADHVYGLAARLDTSVRFRQRTAARRQESEASLGLAHQRALAAATYPRGTARDYAAFLAGVVADSLLSPAVARRVQHYMERPLPGDSARRIGSKSGSFPGFVSFAGYVREEDGPGGRVVVLLMEKLPIAVFYHLMQTGLDKAFELQLLLDDAFFARVRERLSGPPPAASSAARF